MSEIYPDIINEIFFKKEKCAICKEEFNSILLEHPPMDEEHKEYIEKTSKERNEALKERQKNRKPPEQIIDPVYRFLSAECPNLKLAQKFVESWFKGTHKNSIDKQELFIEGAGNWSCTMRAMARHVSRVLEGYDNEPSDAEWWSSDYMQTEYGSNLYHAMCGDY